MEQSRRDFLRASAGAALFGGVMASSTAAHAAGATQAAQGERGAGSTGARRSLRVPSTPGYEPWIEVDDAALRANAREIARIAGGRPVLAVVKNDAYGLGIGRVGPVLDAAPEVGMFAVVKPEEALALREAGVRKPILLMALTEEETGLELARRGVRLAPFTDDAPERLAAVARVLGGPVGVHLYLDTGMNRMGMRHDRAAAWVDALARSAHVRIEGAFTELAESDATDADQLERFTAFAATARARGVPLGTLHAASSHALFHRDGSFSLDAVRPGLALYGAYPAGARGLGRAELRPAFRLRARVVRVERIQPGDGVSYGRNYVATRPTWIATLPVGHADGFPRRAVNGGHVRIGARSYPVIGAVSASHTIAELGPETSVAVGDVATLVGPDDPSIHPNTLAEAAGISVYDVLMHLTRLARR